MQACCLVSLVVPSEYHAAWSVPGLMSKPLAPLNGTGSLHFRTQKSPCLARFWRPSVTSVCLGFVPWISCFALQLLHVTARYSRYSICIGIFKSLGVPSVQRKSQGLCLAAKSVNWRDIKSFKACGTTDLLPDFKYEARRNSNNHRVHEATWRCMQVREGAWRHMKAHEGTWSTWKINKMESTKETGESCATTSLNSVHCRLREAAEALEENSLVSCTSLFAFTKRVDKLLLASACHCSGQVPYHHDQAKKPWFLSTHSAYIMVSLGNWW